MISHIFNLVICLVKIPKTQTRTFSMMLVEKDLYQTIFMFFQNENTKNKCVGSQINK